MANEIEKLCLYLDASSEQPADVTHDAIDALAAEAAEEDIGALVNAVLGGDTAKLIRELRVLAQLGASEGSVLWALLRRRHLIASIRAEFDRSGNLRSAERRVGKECVRTWRNRWSP